ncbi:hypothetical protein BKA69DRAFT_1053153 [Paraphysoderma sedebokerense]|nr:hypothetical protein BKA69DRAFT_1053153 [Paraphysoderma sedebokerense]
MKLTTLLLAVLLVQFATFAVSFPITDNTDSVEAAVPAIETGSQNDHQLTKRRTGPVQLGIRASFRPSRHP